MLKHFFRGSRDANTEIVDAIYAQIVAAARQPVFYADWDVPDTPLGRFEMVSLHMFLFLHRTGGEKGPLADLAQELTDEFFKDIDHSLRELGIGDMGVPKRMKKLAKMFYGRAQSYARAVEAGDLDALADALGRNITPQTENWPQARQLARYMVEAGRLLREQADETFLAGKVTLPDAVAIEQGDDSA